MQSVSGDPDRDQNMNANHPRELMKVLQHSLENECNVYIIKKQIQNLGITVIDHYAICLELTEDGHQFILDFAVNVSYLGGSFKDIERAHYTELGYMKTIYLGCF